MAHFEMWGQKSVNSFGDPVLVPVLSNDTVGDVRERIRCTMGVGEAEFKHWKMAIINMRHIVMDKFDDDEVLLDVWNPLSGDHIGLKHKNQKSMFAEPAALKIKESD